MGNFAAGTIFALAGLRLSVTLSGGVPREVFYQPRIWKADRGGYQDIEQSAVNIIILLLYQRCA